MSSVITATAIDFCSLLSSLTFEDFVSELCRTLTRLSWQITKLKVEKPQKSSVVQPTHFIFQASKLTALLIIRNQEEFLRVLVTTHKIIDTLHPPTPQFVWPCLCSTGLDSIVSTNNLCHSQGSLQGDKSYLVYILINSITIHDELYCVIFIQKLCFISH